MFPARWTEESWAVLCAQKVRQFQRVNESDSAISCLDGAVSAVRNAALPQRVSDDDDLDRTVHGEAGASLG